MKGLCGGTGQVPNGHIGSQPAEWRVKPCPGCPQCPKARRK